MSQTLVVRDPLAELARLEGVPSAVAAARAAVDAVLRDRGRRVFLPEQRARALLAAARANADLTLAPERWLPGCVRLSTELITLSRLIRRAPGQVLARTHALVAQGIVADDQLGQLSGEAQAARVTALHGLLTRPTEAPAIVLGAVVHAELASAAAFGSGDDVVARAAEHLVLIDSGVDPDAVIATEAGHARLAGNYHSALQAYASGTAAGVRTWIVHCCSALTVAAEIAEQQ